MNVACLEDENLETYGDYEALVVGSRTWTSRALHGHCRRLAGALVHLGLAPGDRMVLLLPSGFELMVAFTAVLRAGGVAVVLYPNSQPSEIERIIAHCAAKGLIVTSARASSLTADTIPLPNRCERGRWESRIGCGIAHLRAPARIRPAAVPTRTPRRSRCSSANLYERNDRNSERDRLHTRGDRHALPIPQGDEPREQSCRQAVRPADGASARACARRKLLLLEARFEEHDHLSRHVRGTPVLVCYWSAPRHDDGACTVDVRSIAQRRRDRRLRSLFLADDRRWGSLRFAFARRAVRGKVQEAPGHQLRTDGGPGGNPGVVERQTRFCRTPASSR